MSVLLSFPSYGQTRLTHVTKMAHHLMSGPLHNEMYNRYVLKLLIYCYYSINNMLNICCLRKRTRGTPSMGSLEEGQRRGPIALLRSPAHRSIWHEKELARARLCGRRLQRGGSSGHSPGHLLFRPTGKRDREQGDFRRVLLRKRAGMALIGKSYRLPITDRDHKMDRAGEDSGTCPLRAETLKHPDLRTPHFFAGT